MTGKDTSPDNGADGDLTADERQSAEFNDTDQNDAMANLFEALEAEKADLKERLMRALAETENVRRRAEREAADARTYAVTNFARDMLTVADNVRRALESVPAGEDGPTETLKPLFAGLDLTERDLLKTLARHGVRKLEPDGQKFDPNMHQAMFEVPNPNVPNGTVVQVVQTGYAIGDRVLRPALVGVAKGGPKAAPAAVDPASEGSI